MDNKKNLLVILGPTGIGKSHLAIKVAERLSGEIISGDSMQVYRGMDIGTAKVSAEEQKAIPHHLIDIRDPKEEYSVVDFCQEAKQKIEEIIKRNKVPIIAGGTGLYLQALLEGYDFSDAPEDKDFRDRLFLVEEENPGELYRELEEKDPETALKIEPHNIRRVIRALENIKHGTKLSNQKKEQWVNSSWVIGLRTDREKLYHRINQRVETMINEGWIEECEKLLSAFSLSDTALQAIGYREIFDGLKKGLEPMELIERIQQRTRQFAKRQLTWYRRMEYIAWIDVDEKTDWNLIADEICREWYRKCK